MLHAVTDHRDDQFALLLELIRGQSQFSGGDLPLSHDESPTGLEQVLHQDARRR